MNSAICQLNAHFFPTVRLNEKYVEFWRDWPFFSTGESLDSNSNIQFTIANHRSIRRQIVYMIRCESNKSQLPKKKKKISGFLIDINNRISKPFVVLILIQKSRQRLMQSINCFRLEQDSFELNWRCDWCGAHGQTHSLSAFNRHRKSRHSLFDQLSRRSKCESWIN